MHWGSDRLDADGFVVFLTKPFPTASPSLTRHKYTDPSMTYPASFLPTPLSQQKKETQTKTHTYTHTHTHTPNRSYWTTWTPRSPPPPPPPPIASVESERERFDLLSNRGKRKLVFPFSNFYLPSGATSPSLLASQPVNQSAVRWCSRRGGGRL